MLLTVRGILLWVLIPITLLLWIVTWPILRRQGATLGQLLGWLDLNLVALIQRSLLKPFVRVPLAWTPVKDLTSVTHRIGLTDPA